ncbi:TPA: hypothetical protein ACTA0F_004671 [Salmonella enterica subsp. enterica serovar Bareilly]|nr:hypothetical protein [Escherichia coli]
MSILKKVIVGAFAVAAAVSAPAAMAVEPAPGVDLTPLTSAISFTGVTTAILGIAAAVAGLYALYAGVKHVLRMVRSA